MSFRNVLRKSNFLAAINRRVRDLVSGPGWGAFHHDAIYRKLMIDLIEAVNPSAFVETGTFRGYSTELIASRFPTLPVFTCEVVETSYRLASAALKKYPNVKPSMGTSDQWVQKLLENNEPGGRPFFFLDAHWQHYWPLRSELAHISGARMPCVIVIDDFEVPGQAQFGFDVDGGGEITQGLKCNLDYIVPDLSMANSYRFLFPKYSHQDAFGAAREGMLRGHIIIFQNADDALKQFLERPIFKSYYFEYDASRSAGEARSAAGL